MPTQTSAFSLTHRAIEQAVADGYSLGAEWLAACANHQSGSSVGERVPGFPIYPGLYFETFCLWRPLLAIGLLTRIDPVDLDQPVSRRFRSDLALGAVDYNLRQILNHETDLWWPRLFEYLLLPEEMEFSALLQLSASRARSLEPPPSGYSEVCSSVLILACMRELMGCESSDECVGDLLDDLGLDGAIEFRHESIRELDLLDYAPQIIECRDGTATAAYLERSLRGRPAISVLMTAEGILGFLRHLSKAVRSRPASALAHAVLSPAQPRYHPSLQRRGAFAGSFMANLSDHGFGTCDSRWIGHSGLDGISFYITDPTSDAHLVVLGNSMNVGSRRVLADRETIFRAFRSDLQRLRAEDGGSEDVHG